MNYFKSYYKIGTAYSQNWYGTLDYAPHATVLLYNDNIGYCVGHMESELPNELEPLTVEQVDAELSIVDDEGIYFGHKLTHRWDVIENGE